MKIAIETMPPFLMAGVRFFAAYPEYPDRCRDHYRGSGIGDSFPW
ncbi:hypothetical protein [Paenibacillus piscarius]|nr:hypothetical protein [Paenibacillus piscarius]